MGSITPTPTAEKRAFTLAVVKGGINSSKMGSITLTPTAEKRAAFTLAVLRKAAPTAVKWAA